jgi:glycosyltransferase involved in cell wall biosynthesis
MRITILTDEYLPSGTRVHSKMMHDLATFLMKSGHEPIIVTPGSPNQASKLDIDFVDGIEVWRFRSGYTRGVGMFKRAINEWLLASRAWFAIKSKVKTNQIDLCINYTPTIFFGPLARRFKEQGSFVYLILRDMFPQWIIDQGLIKKNSLAAYFFKYYEKLNYSVADCIGVQSKANLDIFLNKFPEYKNVNILRNWSATEPLNQSLYNKDILIELGIENKIIFFYGGNIGHAQDMANIMRLARNIKHIKEAHFLIVGQGDEYELIKELKSEWKLENVTILPSISQKKFSQLLPEIDIGLFSLSYQHTAHNFPGKLLGYMLESKPILGSVNPGNDLLEMVNASNSGKAFINGEDDLLANAAINFITNQKLRAECGLNAKKLLLQEFSVESAAQKILSSKEI